jgi:copper chaperone CopZ
MEKKAGEGCCNIADFIEKCLQALPGNGMIKVSLERNTAA